MIMINKLHDEIYEVTEYGRQSKTVSPEELVKILENYMGYDLKLKDEFDDKLDKLARHTDEQVKEIASRIHNLFVDYKKEIESLITAALQEKS